MATQTIKPGTSLASVKVAAGDTILLLRGASYPGGLALRSGVTVRADGDPKLVDPVIVCNGTHGVAIYERAEDIHVEDVTFRDATGCPALSTFNGARKGRLAGVQVQNTVQELTVAKCSFEGFAMGIQYEFHVNPRSRDHTYEDCRFLGNWESDDQFGGQGLFMAHVLGVKFNRCVFADNGLVPAKAGNWKRTMFRHGAYLSAGNQKEVTPAEELVFTECAALDNANFGWQNRCGPAAYFRCFLAGNANGLLVNGPASFYLEDCGFVCDGAYDEQQPLNRGGKWVKVGGGGLHAHGKEVTVTRGTFVQPAPVTEWPQAAITAGPRGGSEGWEYRDKVTLRLNDTRFAGTFPAAVTVADRSSLEGKPLLVDFKKGWDAKTYAQLKVDLKAGRVGAKTAVNWLRAQVA